MIQPQQLRVLVAIRDHGSLTAAARALGYGVPTIAHHLAALERHFKARLVERDRSGARLTPLGTVFVAEAEQILIRLDQAERLVTTQRDLGLATIRVGTFASIGSQLLPRAIRQLSARMQVKVEVVEAEPTDVVELLHAGDLHAGLIYDSADDPAFTSPELELTVLLEEDYRVLVARDSPYADLPEVDLAELADADWVCSRDENEASDRVLRRACHLLGFQPKVLMRTDDLNMIHGLVAEGLGCTLTTHSAVDTRFAVEPRPTVQELGLRRTSFVHGGSVVPPAVVELQQMLTKLLPQQQG
ncbi:molybdate transport repressor ModE-like protein [Lentzea atacamensis]|uniref:Molybdate transport repressor ModE-like protein n=1 Tax=Lentzea atacamensis TaxID=531938 RepID=A0ABX9EAW0_9PSEU|nr:LysR family transcriptional regulator [Lentzea atacamensis]RAS67294.1 molybdate transport repressor ModE-like protein [Lentzea atacamensis]